MSLRTSIIGRWTLYWQNTTCPTQNQSPPLWRLQCPKQLLQSCQRCFVCWAGLLQLMFHPGNKRFLNKWHHKILHKTLQYAIIIIIAAKELTSAPTNPKGAKTNITWWKIHFCWWYHCKTHCDSKTKPSMPNRSQHMNDSPLRTISYPTTHCNNCFKHNFRKEETIRE